MAVCGNENQDHALYADTYLGPDGMKQFLESLQAYRDDRLCKHCFKIIKDIYDSHQLKKALKTNLCTYDPRNPHYIEDSENTPGHKDCMCDNCFYGRHWMAGRLLELIK